MASGMDWFRWHHGSVSDPKFQLVARRSGASVAEVLAVWASLLEAASTASARGSIGLPDFEAIDCALGLEEGAAARIFAAMEARGLVDGAEQRIVAWDKRQPKRERGDDDGSTARVRAHREKSRHATPGNANSDHGTPCNATERQETPRGEERREELTPPVAPSADAEGAAPPPSEPEPAKAGKATRRASERAESLTLPAWLTLVRAKGEKAVPSQDPVYRYAEQIGLPDELLGLAWQVFKRRYATRPKRYRDWRAVFRRAVEENWLRLWYLQEGAGYALTTQGTQARLAIEAERAGAAA